MEVTMYLSKVLVAGSFCRNPYDVHRALWSFFPGDTESRRDFLFRIVQADHAWTEMLMQSTRLPEQQGDMARIVACKEFTLVLQAGQRLSFLIVANPVKTIDDEGARLDSQGRLKKCRVPLVREVERREWLERKLQKFASLETVIIESGLPIRFKKGRESRVGKIQPVKFRGVLEVKDVDGLSEIVRNGIGPAKAFGCGMLSLARA